MPGPITFWISARGTVTWMTASDWAAVCRILGVSIMAGSPRQSACFQPGEQLVEPFIALGHAGLHATVREVTVAGLHRLVHGPRRDRRLPVALLERQRLDRLRFREEVEDVRPDDPLGGRDLLEDA